MMTTKEVADKLVELCRQGKNEEAMDTLFADDTKSIEANDLMGPCEIQGLAAIKAKSAGFQQRVEAIHSSSISEPVVAGNSFAIGLTMDVTFKERGRVTLEEICVYQVKDGKVILEQFFY